MTNTATLPGASPAPLSLPARFVGIITAPKETFQAVAAHPRWLGMLLVCNILIALCTALPMTTEAGKEATLRQQVEGMESFGMQVSDQMYEQLRGRMWMAPYQTAIGILVFSPVFTVARVTPRQRAISGFEQPWETNSAICCSRSVSGSSPACIAFG